MQQYSGGGWCDVAGVENRVDLGRVHVRECLTALSGGTGVGKSGAVAREAGPRGGPEKQGGEAGRRSRLIAAATW